MDKIKHEKDVKNEKTRKMIFVFEQKKKERKLDCKQSNRRYFVSRALT
jgi:hypothetical protein